MTREEAEAFARSWIASWNRADVETVASHYAADCVFISPRAAAVTGDPVVRGRDALLAYWTKGRALAGSFDFRLLNWNWDKEARVLVVRYLSKRGTAEPMRAVEIMRFDAGGKVVEGEALYGAQARIS